MQPYRVDNYESDPIYQLNEQRSMCRHTIKSKEERMVEDTRSNFEDAADMVRQIKRDAAKRKHNKLMSDEVLERYPVKVKRVIKKEE